MDLQIKVDERKAKQFVAFLKELDFVEVTKTVKTESKKIKKTLTFSYFDSCPDWDVDAAVLRKKSNQREKAKW